jgi:Cu/Ag efflux protein CusF
MNININVNITFQPAKTVHTAPEAIAEQPTFEVVVNDIDHESAKIAMIVKRLEYRQRIADKLRAMFGDDTANQFLAGAL